MRSIANAIWAAAVLLGAVSGCSRPPDYLYVDPRAQPVRVELRKNFGHINQHFAPVPITECVFYEVNKTGESGDFPYPQELWRVLSVAPDRPVLDVRYGVLPPGFLQAVPSREVAPSLQPGHHYTVECTVDTMATSEFVVPEVVTRPEPPQKGKEPARARRRQGASGATPLPADRRTTESRP